MKSTQLYKIANAKSVAELEEYLPDSATNGVRIGNYFARNIYFDGSLNFPKLEKGHNGWLVGKHGEFKVAKFFVKDNATLDAIVASSKGSKILRTSPTTFLAKYPY